MHEVPAVNLTLTEGALFSAAGGIGVVGVVGVVGVTGEVGVGEVDPHATAQPTSRTAIDRLTRHPPLRGPRIIDRDANTANERPAAAVPGSEVGAPSVRGSAGV